LIGSLGHVSARLINSFDWEPFVILFFHKY